MSTIVDYNYKNNVNRRTNDIFNKFIYDRLNKSTALSTHSRVKSNEIKSACITPYSYKSNSKIIPTESSSSIKSSYYYNTSSEANRDRNGSIYNLRENKKLSKGLNNSRGRFGMDTNTFDRGNDTSEICITERLNTTENNYKDIMQFNESVEQLSKNQIERKINYRGILTESASKSLINFRSSSKNIISWENDDNFLDKFCDHDKQRAKTKNENTNKLISKNLEKFINFERPAKKQFYESYVDSLPALTDPSYSTGYCNTYNGDDPEFKKKYCEGLIEQIRSNSKNRIEIRMKKLEEERKDQVKNMSEYRRDTEEKNKKTKFLNDSLIITNLKILNEKKQKENDAKHMERLKIQSEINQINHRISEDTKDMLNRKNYSQKIIRENLLNQVEEKKKRQVEEFTKSKKEFNESTGFKFSCDIKKLIKNNKIDLKKQIIKYN